MNIGLPARLLTRRIEVLRATKTTDRYGNEVWDWTNPTVFAHSGWVSPVDSTEDIADRDGRRIDAKLFLPSGSQIDAGDRVRVDGAETYEVIGPPLVFHSPRGPHHIEAAIAALEG